MQNDKEEPLEAYGEPDEDSLSYRVWECLRRWASIICCI